MHGDVHKCALMSIGAHAYKTKKLTKELPLTDFIQNIRIGLIDMNEIFIYSAIIILLLSNVTFAFLYSREKLKVKKPPKDNLEVNELLMDLMNGEAVIRCQRVVPTDVFLRSPRGRA